MALSDPILEEEQELELGPSDGDSMSPLECLESPEAEDNAGRGHSGIGGSGQQDRELPAFKNAGEDRVQTGSDAERQKTPTDEGQLPPPPDPRTLRI